MVRGLYEWPSIDRQRERGSSCWPPQVSGDAPGLKPTSGPSVFDHEGHHSASSPIDFAAISESDKPWTIGSPLVLKDVLIVP